MVKQVPHAKEAEREILSMIIAEPDTVIPKCVSRGVTEESFFTEVNQFLFKYFLWRKEKNYPLDLPLIYDHLNKKGKLDYIGGPGALSELFESSSSLAHFDHYLQVLQETYSRRMMFIRLATLDTEEANADDMAALLKEVAEEASRIITTEEEEKISDQVRAFEENFAAKAQNAELSYGFRTGSRKLDELTLGLHRGTLTVVAGKPSTGKSVLMLQFVAEALQRGESAIVFSMEMSSEEVIRRLCCYLSGVELEDIQKPTGLSKQDLTKISEALKFISESHLVIDDRPALRLSQITDKLARGSFSMAAVDYLGLMSPEAHQRKLMRSEQLESVSRSLKAAAKKHNLAMLVGSQLNDNDQTKGSKGPQEDGDIVMRILSRPKNEGDDPVVYGIKLDKNRNGQRFAIAGCHLNGRLQRFTFHENAE